MFCLGCSSYIPFDAEDQQSAVSGMKQGKKQLWKNRSEDA